MCYLRLWYFVVTCTLQSPQNGDDVTKRVKELSVADRSSSGPYLDLTLVEEDVFTNGTIADSSNNCNHDNMATSLPGVARKTRKYSEVTKVSLYFTVSIAVNIVMKPPAESSIITLH